MKHLWHSVVDDEYNGSPMSDGCVHNLLLSLGNTGRNEYGSFCGSSQATLFLYGEKVSVSPVAYNRQ